MNKIDVVYEGNDLVIKRELLESIGLRKGDKVVIHAKLTLAPANFSEEERKKRTAIIDETWGAWTEEDEEAYRKNRTLMNRG